MPETVIVIRCNKTELDGKTPCIHDDCTNCILLSVLVDGTVFEIVGEADEWK